MVPTRFDEVIKFNSVQTGGFIKVGDTSSIVRETFFIDNFGSDSMWTFWKAISVVRAASSNSFGSIGKAWGASAGNDRNRRFRIL